jgi:putative flippase GtrA
MKIFSRFVLVGILNSALGYSLIFFLMYFVRLSPLTSNIIGYAICLIISYTLQRNFTFASKQNKRQEFVKFLTVFCTAYLVNFLTLSFLIHNDFNSGLSQIVAGIFYIVTSFTLNKVFVFQHPTQRLVK